MEQYEQYEELLTVPQVARILNVNGTTVRRWVQHGELQAVFLPAKPGGRKKYRIRKRDLDKIMGAGCASA